MIRKFLAIVLILMFSVVPCTNAEIDLSGYSESELRDLIQQARSELTKYNSPAEKGTVIYEDEYVKITYSDMELHTDTFFYIRCIVENKSNYNLHIWMERAQCNGWDFNHYKFEGKAKVSALSKNRSYFCFSGFQNSTGIESVEEIEEIRYTIEVLDADTSKTLNKPEGYFYLDMPITVK